MKKTEWRGLEYPPEYIKKKNAGQMQLVIYTDVREEQVDSNEIVYCATEITMPVGVADYGSIVSSVINAHYSADTMQAIINNHLIGEGEEYFAEMQEYRLYAKTLARKIVNEINKESEVSNG